MACFRTCSDLAESAVSTDNSIVNKLACFGLLLALTASGADHWAYQPPKTSSPPSVKETNWPVNDVDRFILARLEQNGLVPARDANKTALLRRVYFDLIGLPPNPEQTDAFLNDGSPDAFTRLVDQLLASPRFGERWGRHWLDVTRFAESVTLRGFIFKEAWRYRDYVIDAFNRDLPYDQFLREHVAGDLLPGGDVAERQRRHVATTFLMLGNTNFEEQDKKQLEMDVVDEQLDVIGKGFLAQTITCARCHDHKFDPIPTRDYYAMAGILKSTKALEHENVSKWLELPLPVEPEAEAGFREHESNIAALQAQLKQAKARLAKTEGSAVTAKKGMPIAPSELPGIVVDDKDARRVGAWVHSQYSKSYIGDGYVHDDNKEKGQKTITFQPELTRAGRYEVRLAYVHSPSRAPKVGVHILHADGEATVYIDQKELPGIDGRFTSLGQYRFEANGQGYVLLSNEDTSGHVIADAVQFIPVEMLEALASRAPNTNAAEVKRLEAELKQLTENGPKRPRYISVKESEEVGDIHINIRGSVRNLGEKAPRGFLHVATRNSPPQIPQYESGRRQLAEWLASRDNPLAARVMVNRVWHWLFGAGLVRTTDNFGTTGEQPSHPELLDYLAVRFMDEGWSVKKLIKLLVASRTYQLSATALSGDPENRWLGRMNRKRLEAESLRDVILQISGRLQHMRGGPTIKAGTAADYGYRFDEPVRSVYVPVLRNAIPEIFDAFDFADPNTVTGRRNTSTVAPQALYFMNHPWIREQARSAAERVLNMSEPDRIDFAWRSCLGRPPAEGERRLVMNRLREGTPEEAWTEIFQGLFGSLDFRYVE
jgi:hypothetical protein